METTILCYVRKSWVPNSSRTISPKQQREAIQALVKTRGFTCEWYEDIEGHRSGRSEEGRPAWLKLKTQLTRTDVAGVAGYDLSRLYRNVKEFLGFIDMLERLDKRLLLSHEFIDTGTAGGRAVATILVTMHQLQADRTSERVKANIEYRRCKLGQHHGPIPYGCTRVAGKLKPAQGDKEKDLEALTYLYKIYTTKHLSYDYLSEHLNKQGYAYRNRRGEPRPWGREDVRRALANHQLYAGHIPLRRGDRDQPEKVIYNTHAPIIDCELCKAVAREIEGRRHRTQRGAENQYLLSSTVFCATCGRKLAGYCKNGIRYYRHQGSKLGCPESWQKAVDLEESAIKWLARLDNDALYTSLHNQALDILAKNATADIAEKTREAEERNKRLSTLYLNNHISSKDYYGQYQKIMKTLEVLQAQIPDSQALALKNAATRLQDLTNNISGACFARQKRVIQSTFKRLETRALYVVKTTLQNWITPLRPLIEAWLLETQSDALD